MPKITTHSLHGSSIYFKKVTISNYPQNCEIAKCYICHRSSRLEKKIGQQKYFILMIGLYVCLCKSSDQV